MADLDSVTIVSILEDFISSMNATWDYFAIFGISCASAVLISCFLRCFSCFRTYIFSRLWYTKDFSSKYGGNWAVITGASDGIGRSYAFQLAERKMNVFLISRNLNKLKNVADEIESKYNVCTRSYPMDLCDISHPDKYDQLKRELELIDVGILVNNVGVMYDRLQYFLTVPKERQLQIINLNITSTVLMTYMLLPQMVGRNKGALINVSSGASVHPTPLMTTYSASKHFVDSFTDALQYEYSSYGIVMQAVKPFYVSTNMTYRGKPNFFLVHPDVYVRSALCMLGSTHRTYGYWAHGIFGVVGELMPGWFYRFCSLYVNPYLWSFLTGVKVDNKKAR